MLRTRVRGVYQALLGFQFVLAFGLYWSVLWAFVLFYPSHLYFDLSSYVYCCGAMCLALVLHYSNHSLDQMQVLHPTIYVSHKVSWSQTLSVSLALLLYLFASKNETVSRVFLFSFLLLLHSLFVITHRYLPEFFADISFRGARKQRTLLIGPLRKAVRMKDWLTRKGRIGIQLVGVISNEAESGRFSDIEILPIKNNLEETIRHHKVNLLVLLELPTNKNDLRGLFSLCEKCGARLLIVNDLEEILGHSINAVQDDGFNFIGLRTEPLENPFNRIQKRLLDILISLPVVCLILPPIGLIVSFFHKRQSPGPLFISQERGGFQGHRFPMLKFRTMHADNNKIAQQATRDDPRIFAAGKWIRRYSVDELPQFWNVLIGQMSIVGPRPHLLEHDASFSEITRNYLVRSYVKPGITGLAQVEGFRGSTQRQADLFQRVEYDIQYIENWSLRLDLWIIIRTIKHMICPPPSAY